MKKELTPQESMAIISQMIDASKQRVTVFDLRISIMWAVLTITTAALVLILRLTTHGPLFNMLWFAIPVIGLPLNFFMKNKDKNTEGKAQTYIDSVSRKIWKTVSFIAVFLMLICLALHLSGYPQAWLVMLFYAFLIVGFGAVMQGIVIKENSYISGGLFSILSGFVVIAATVCNIPLLATWLLPLYMLCFFLMFIVPAIIIRKKSNRKPL